MLLYLIFVDRCFICYTSVSRLGIIDSKVSKCTARLFISVLLFTILIFVSIIPRRETDVIYSGCRDVFLGYYLGTKPQNDATKF